MTGIFRPGPGITIVATLALILAACGRGTAIGFRIAEMYGKCADVPGVSGSQRVTVGELSTHRFLTQSAASSTGVEKVVRARLGPESTLPRDVFASPRDRVGALQGLTGVIRERNFGGLRKWVTGRPNRSGERGGEMTSVEFLDRENGIPEGPRRALVDGEMATWRGDYAVASKTLREVEGGRHPLAAAFATLKLADVDHFLWNLAPAYRGYDRAIRAFRRLDHDSGRIFSSFRRADVLVDFNKANPIKRRRRSDRPAFERAFAEAKRLDDDFLVAFGHHYTGLFRFAEGRYQDAMGSLERAIEIRQKIGDDLHRLSSQSLLSAALGALGRLDDARRMVDDTLATQLELDLKGAALRTLSTRAAIADRQNYQAIEDMAAALVPIGPLEVSPFVTEVTNLNWTFRAPLIRPTVEEYQLAP